MATVDCYNPEPVTPTQITREYYSIANDTPIQLGIAARNFLITDFEVYDVATGGTPLTENTDYELTVTNDYIKSKYDVDCKTRFAITNAAYYGDIWITYKVFSSETDAEFFNYLNDTDTDLQNQITALTAAGANPFITNCQLSNGTDSDHDIDIAIGSCYDSTYAYFMNLSSGLTKQIDAAWAVGTNAGGLFTGTVANTTTYHVFLIRKDLDASLEAGFDTSLTAANIPTGYTAYRRLGSVVTDGSANIRQFIHTWQNKMFRWVTKSVVTSWQVPLTATLTAMDVPLGIEVNPIGLFTGGSPTGSQTTAFNIYSPNETPPALLQKSASESTFNGVCGTFTTAGLWRGGTTYKIYGETTNTSGQLYFLRIGTYENSSGYSTLQTHAWIDYTL